MADRLIPPCNMDTVDPSQIYNIEDMIPLNISNALDVKVIWKAREIVEAWEFLAPLQYEIELTLRIGSFLKNKFLAALTEKKDKLLVKRVYYSTLILACFSCLHAENVYND
jgi:hypothetical protein